MRIKRKLLQFIWQNYCKKRAFEEVQFRLKFEINIIVININIT